MSKAAAVLALTLLLAAVGCTPSPPPSGATPQVAEAAVAHDPARGGARRGNWLRAESERDTLPIVWEFRDDYVPAESRPQLVIVSQVRDVPYVGQADPPLEAELAAREDRLLAALAGRAELVAVLDWRQQHDWFFYADGSVTRESITAAFGAAGGRDVQVTVEADGGAFYSALKQRTAAQPEAAR